MHHLLLNTLLSLVAVVVLVMLAVAVELVVYELAH
jgi:hypothetical protein